MRPHRQLPNVAIDRDLGPSELSIIDLEVVNYVLGPGSPCIRPAWFEEKSPVSSIALTGDRSQHSARRKAWAPRFNLKTLDSYRSRIDRHVAELENHLSRSQGRSADASCLFKRFGYDVVSDLTFGSSFNTLRSGKSHPAVSTIGKGLRASGHLGNTPWLSCMLSDPASASARTRRLQEWCEANSPLARRYASIHRLGPPF